MRDLLDMAARHADAAELYIVNSEVIPVTFEMNKLKHAETRTARDQVGKSWVFFLHRYR